MGKRFFILSLGIVFAFFPSLVRCQQVAPSIIWQKCLGGSGNDEANSIVRTPDGGFLVAGYSQSNDGDVTGHHGSVDSMDAWGAGRDGGQGRQETATMSFPGSPDPMTGMYRAILFRAADTRTKALIRSVC